MANKRYINPVSMRNLPQYKNMSDDEFTDMVARRELSLAPVAEYEKRIEVKMGQFEKDYDLSEMLINDMLALRHLCKALIQLEDYETIVYRLSQDSESMMNPETIMTVEKLSNIMSKLRQDISKLQEDLKIRRKERRSEEQASLIQKLEDLDKKAKLFYEQKMLYILCPKCKQLLATVWVKNIKSKQNRIQLYCNKDIDGTSCNTQVDVDLCKMYEEKKSCNVQGVLPERMQ